MRYLIIIFYFFIIFFKSQFLFAQNLVYLDINFIINNSLIGKKISNELDLINKKNLTYLKQEQSILNNKRIEIENKKNIVSEEKLKSQIDILNNEIDLFKKKQDQLSLEFKELNRNKINELIKKINSIIEQYMIKNEIRIIFNKESVYVSLDDGDITNEILELVDSVLKWWLIY